MGAPSWTGSLANAARYSGSVARSSPGVGLRSSSPALTVNTKPGPLAPYLIVSAARPVSPSRIVRVLLSPDRWDGSFSYVMSERPAVARERIALNLASALLTVSGSAIYDVIASLTPDG